MKTFVTALAAAMLLIGPMAMSDDASAGHRRHWAKHHAKHYRHVVRYPRYRHHAYYPRQHRKRIVVQFGFGGCYDPCGCW